jgi:hypothetical protein
VWSPTKEQPEWVFELTPSWLGQVGQIVRQTHVKLILDLNLVTTTPALAARWAKTDKISVVAALRRCTRGCSGSTRGRESHDGPPVARCSYHRA